MTLRIVLLGFLAASCTPPPRDVAWFESHPAEARAILAGCAAGDRDMECETARGGLARAERTARMARYRSGYE